MGGRFMAGRIADQPWMDEPSCLMQSGCGRVVAILISREALRSWPVHVFFPAMTDIRISRR